MDYAIKNGEFCEKKKVDISLEDRGYQFGDGIYEVIRVYNSKPFLLTEHLLRFQRSTAEIQMSLPYSISELTAMLEKLVSLNNVTYGKIYMQMTRGVALRNHCFPELTEPILTAYTEFVSRPLDMIRSGISVITTEDIRWTRVDIKSLNLLPNVLARQLAKNAGANEAILIRNGIITECSASNVYFVKDGAIYTHPANNFILNGITRQKLKQLAAGLDIPWIENPLTKEEIYDVNEVFISGTVCETCPVISIDGITIADGKAGKISKKLQDAFEAEILAVC